jgi:raffinose/stachyose/melibiose transport system substrate-binding protein
MTIKSKLTAGAAVAAAALVLLATGCSTSDTPASSSGGGDQTLTFWVPSLLSKEAKNFPTKFEAAEQGVKVNVVTIPDPFESNLLAKWTAGDRPDVLYFHGIGNWLAQLNPAKNLEDLSSEPFVSRTVPDLLASSTTSQGKVYGALVDAPAIDGILYNKPLFKQLNLPIPTTLDQLIATCAAIKQKAPNKIPITMGAGDKWPVQILPFLLFNDGIKANPNLMSDLNQNKTHFTDPVFVQGFQGLQTANKSGCFGKDVSTTTFENSQKQLVNGDAAMMAALTQFVPLLTDAFGADKVNQQVGFFPLSLTSNVTSWQMTGEAIYLPKTNDAAKTALAKKYVDWITGTAYQDYINATHQYPVITGITTPADSPTASQEAQAAFTANSVPQYQQTLQADYGDIATFLSEMLFNGKTPQWVGEQLQSAFSRNAQTQGLSGF